MKTAILLVLCVVLPHFIFACECELKNARRRRKCGCCPEPCECKVFRHEEVGECTDKLDLAFMLDTSGSISATDFIVAKAFVGDIADSLGSVGDGQRVAMITYSLNASLLWNLDGVETSSKANLLTAIDGMVQVPSFTNTAEALEMCGTDVFGSPADDPASPNVGVLITDGRSSHRRDEVGALAQQMRDQGTTLICIGITNLIDMDELKEICDEDLIFTENSYSELVNVLEEVNEEICPQKKKKEFFCCCSPNIIWNLGLGRSN